MPDFTNMFEDFVRLLNPSTADSGPSPMNITTAGNATKPHFELPVTVLESFIPGYGLIRKIALDMFGIDISILVSILGFLFVLRTATSYSRGFLTELVSDYLTVNIDMGEHDDPYEPLMKFTVHKGALKARSLRAAGRWWENLLDSKQKMLEEAEKASGVAGKSSLYNTRTLEAKRPMGYEPDAGSYHFWHNNRLYFITLYKMTYQYRHDEYNRLSISTFGWSAEPLKRFLEEVRAGNDDHEDETTFFRADPHDSDWRCVASRPTRPLNTVALETYDKLRLVRDVNDFIHPTRAKWYSSRGIPYRRGYLFSGPPGTGKTSLSLALAGVFGLGLYALSLQDSAMTEERLTQLFDYLPDRCVVLLEDIDSAGLGEKRTTEEVTSGSSLTTEGGDTSMAENGDKNDPNALKKVKKSGVSLAGLLNAIDGVASHEGHVLIMTTNHPEKLDAALKRPGRVDMHIAFTLATRFQAREIFLRMFTDELDSGSITAEGKTKSKTGTSGPHVLTVEDVCRERSELADSRTCPFMKLSDLDALADAFVAKLPEQVFSPAEIQGFLLMYKSEPERAVRDLDKWMEESGKMTEGVEKDRLKTKVKKEQDDDEGSGVEVERADAMVEAGKKEKGG